MSESDVSALKDTLYAQQKLLQKLYNELEAERESSATAASEALSYILRIQGEKAALKMESEQYKRFSEEKIYHAEESLAITEDIIYQKEMEIAALDCQVQAYRYKLLSMGCVLDSGFGDSPFQRDDDSAPISPTYKKVIHERESKIIREKDLVSRNVEEKKGGNSYMEQIRRLDYQVREITGDDSCELSSNSANYPCPNPHELTRKNDADVHDVFEVPQDDIDGNLNPHESVRRDEYVLQTEARNLNPHESVRIDENALQTEARNFNPHESVRKDENALQTEAVKRHARDEFGWLEKMLCFTYHEKSLCRPSHEVAPIDCHLALVQPRISVSESQLKLNRLNMRSEIVEVEGPTESSKREEELRLLNEIREKLNSLHDEIMSLKVKKPSSSASTSDETSLYAFREAMLYFWL